MKKNIKVILLFIALASFCVVSDAQSLTIESNRATQNYDVIVIGGGMAGASAASTLAKAGKKVLILEANDYIGGRMKTQKVPLLQNKWFNFEFGANWIHGANPSHPISKLAEEVGNFQSIQTSYPQLIVYDERRNDISQSVGAKLYSYFEATYSLGQFAGRNISIADGLRITHPQILTDSEAMFHTSYTQFSQSASIDKINADFVQGYQQINGIQMLMVLSGYQRMPQYLANHSKIRILFNHKVIKVNKNGESTTVTCSNGYKAQSQHIIIAVPLGVLKKNTINFIPALPSWKRNSIEKIGFGNVVKILIVPKIPIVLSQQKPWIGVALDDISQRGSAMFYLNLQFITNSQVLMTFGLGPNADRLETMGEANLKQLIAKRLTIFMNSTVKANDFDIIRSNWRTNPNFGGAYSFTEVQTNLSHWSDIAKPLLDRNWFFAGEHTHDKYRATVHGAYLSGETAAKKILRLRNN